MEPLTLASCSLYRYRLPFAEPVTFKGGRETHREGFLVRLASEAGAEAWGEAAPLPGFSRERPGEAEEQLCRLCTAMVGRRVGEGLVAPDGAWRREVEAMNLAPSVCFGFEAAAWQLYAAAVGKTLPELCTPSPRPTISLNGLLLGTGAEVEAQARRLVARGYRTVKLKVGRASVEEDVERTRRVRAVLGEERNLRLDANRAWSYEQATAFAEGIRWCGVEYLEEPLFDAGRLAEFASATGVPVALDESAVALEPDQVEAHRYAKAVVLKPTLLGWGRSLSMARAADAAGITPVVSASFETGVGMRALVALAAAVGTQPVAAGLDTYRWLEADVVSPRLDVSRPCIDVFPLMRAPWGITIEALDLVG